MSEEIAHVQHITQGDLDFVLASCGFQPPPLGKELREYIYDLGVFLGRGVHGANIVRGYLLQMAHEQGLWMGKSSSWKEYCEDLGLSVFDASRLRTIAKWMKEQNVTPAAALAVKDGNKLYALAVRARKMIEGKEGEEREKIVGLIDSIVSEAPTLSRDDVNRSLDSIGAPVIDPCNLYLTKKICCRTGEVDPMGCENCVEGFKPTPHDMAASAEYVATLPSKAVEVPNLVTTVPSYE